VLVPRLNSAIYESLPTVYVTAGAVLMWLSYHSRSLWWSTPCALAGLLAVIAGLVIWMRRRDYRATSAAYRRRGRAPGETGEEPPSR
jgi:hypothetical protein